MSPELLLAAACTMWPPSDRRNEAIHAAASGHPDWTRFLRVIQRHGVVGLVNDGLARVQPEMPSSIAHTIRAEARISARKSLTMAAEAVRLQALFDDAGVVVLFLKGASLGVLAYGNLGLRDGKDIDLLVSKAELLAATAVVKRAGYRRFDPPPDIGDGQMRWLMSFRKDLGFVHENTGLHIELHWQLFLNPHAMEQASAMAASRVIPMTATTGLRTLGEEDLFAYLCVHGALHWWYQLKWLADIGALLAAAPEGGAERFYRGAEARGAGRAAAQAMLLCQRLLDTPLPIRLMKKLGESPKVRWLQETALAAMTAGSGEREPRETRFGTTRGSLSALLLGETWRYRLAEMRNLLINETDVLAVPLPERLAFLYPILRLPLWIWRHANQRNARAGARHPKS
jgi:hypothetical protein